MYNAPGGYVIGQVWKDHNSPDPTAANFPDGTVSCKLLFTTATAAQVPYLKNAFQWQADVSLAGSTTRAIHTVSLLQVALRAASSGVADLLLSASAADGRVELEFEISDPRSPAELGLGADRRLLGAGLEWLALIA